MEEHSAKPHGNVTTTPRKEGHWRGLLRALGKLQAGPGSTGRCQLQMPLLSHTQNHLRAGFHVSIKSGRSQTNGKQKVYFQEVLVPKVGGEGGKTNIIFLIRFLQLGQLTMWSIQTCLNLQARIFLLNFDPNQKAFPENQSEYKQTCKVCSFSTRATSLRQSPGLSKSRGSHSLFALLAAGRCFLALDPDGWFCFHEGI